MIERIEHKGVLDATPGFRCVGERTVFDIQAAGLPIEREAGQVADMGKLLPHAGGKAQTLVHRVRPCSLRPTEPRRDLKKIVTHKVPYLTDAHFAATGIYYAKVHYREAMPGRWTFA